MAATGILLRDLPGGRDIMWSSMPPSDIISYTAKTMRRLR